MRRSINNDVSTLPSFQKTKYENQTICKVMKQLCKDMKLRMCDNIVVRGVRAKCLRRDIRK